jgi:O-antigen/teichoic acid export membrane protein
MVWGQVAKTLEALLTLAIAVAAVRALNPNAFGLYSLLTYLAGSASVIIPIVVVEAVGAVLPRFRDARERLYLMGVLTVLRLTVIVVAALVLFPGWETVRDWFGLTAISHRVFVVAVVYWLAQDMLNSFAGFYLVELNMRPVAIWKPIGQLVALVAILGVVATEDRWASSVGEVLTSVALGYLVAAAGLALGLRRYGRPRSPGRAAVRGVLSYTRNTWLISVLQLALTTHFDVLLIGALTGSLSQAAFYVLAVGVIGRAQALLTSAWSSLMIPALGEARVTGGEGGLALAWSLFARLWLMVALPINVLLLATAQPLVEVLFGEQYAAAGDLLLVVAAFNVVSALLLGPLAISMLWALDRQDVVLRVRLGTAFLNVALAVPLIFAFEAMGAVVATGVASVATGVAELALARRQASLGVPVRFGAQILVAAAVAAVPAYLLAPYGAAGLAAAIAAGVATFVGMLAVLRPLGAADLAAAERFNPRLAQSLLRRFASV